jgi:hypothetical protein
MLPLARLVNSANFSQAIHLSEINRREPGSKLVVGGGGSLLTAD